MFPISAFNITFIIRRHYVFNSTLFSPHILVNYVDSRASLAPYAIQQNRKPVAGKKKIIIKTERDHRYPRAIMSLIIFMVVVIIITIGPEIVIVFCKSRM